jgi:hypothetical protein
MLVGVGLTWFTLLAIPAVLEIMQQLPAVYHGGTPGFSDPQAAVWQYHRYGRSGRESPFAERTFRKGRQRAVGGEVSVGPLERRPAILDQCADKFR